MNKIGHLLLILVFTLAFVMRSEGQVVDSSTVLYLETNLQESFVFADTIYLGRANQFVFRVPEETREIKLVPPDIDSWSIAPVTRSFSPAERDTIALSINFPFYYKIESIPYDTKVFLEQPNERQLLGSTPLLYTSTDPLKGMLLLTKDGHESLRLTPGENVWNQHYVELEEGNYEGVVSSERYWTPEKSNKRWLDITLAGASLVSGVLAIRYKAKANRRFDRYRRSGDPALRNGFERYDRYAAISLGAMQAGVGVLAIRLVLK